MDLASFVSIIVKILAVLIAAMVTIAAIVQGLHAALELLDRWRKRREEPPHVTPMPPRERIEIKLPESTAKVEPPSAPTEERPPIPQPPRRPEPRFIDRHDREGRDLVKRVSEALGANGLVTVWGSGGVGKTTLAIEVARRLCPSPYSGGVIWSSADGRADFALVTLLDKVVTDLGREEARNLAADAKAYVADRLLTEAMPCLLALDNFETIADEEQTAIIAFLNELSCPVLVTSRESVPIGQNIRVGPMTKAEAREFVELRIEQSSQPDKLREIDLDHVAKVAERNPMLMRWVVAQLERAMRPESVFDEIARGKGEAVDRIFGRSFDLLDDDGQMALLALALFVPTASREALAAVCGFEDGKDRVNEAIRRLAAFDLVDTAVEGDRLGIVALTRRLTEAQLRKDERTEGLKERFVAYFLAYAEARPKVTKEDLDALDDERENLLATLDYAYASEDWQSVIMITDTIAFPGLLDIRGYWDEAIKWGERALEAARTAQDARILAIFAHNTGVIYESRGHYKEAKNLYNQSLEIKRQQGDRAGIAISLHQLGMVAQRQGDYEEARTFYNQSLEIKRQLGDQAGIAPSLYQLGTIAQVQGDYQDAKILYSQSLEIARNLGNQEGLARCLHQLGTVAQDQGDYQEAKGLLNQSLEITTNLGAQSGIAISLHQLGIVAQDQGDFQEAKDLFNRSLQIKRNLGDQAGIATSLHQLGMIAQVQGNYQEARDLYTQSLEIATNLGDQAGIASSLGQLGRLAEASGDVQEAAELYAEGLVIFERLGLPDAEKARRDLARVTGKKE